MPTDNAVRCDRIPDGCEGCRERVPLRGLPFPSHRPKPRLPSRTRLRSGRSDVGDVAEVKPLSALEQVGVRSVWTAGSRWGGTVPVFDENRGVVEPGPASAEGVLDKESQESSLSRCWAELFELG